MGIRQVNVLTPTMVLGCMLAIASGCSDGRPTRVPISGKVSIDGKPLAGGSIMFLHPESRSSGSPIDADGRFQLTCYVPGDGAVLGKHRVKVTACESLSERSNRWLAPKKYADPNSSGLEVEVTEPKDDLEINLTWGGDKPFVERW